MKLNKDNRIPELENIIRKAGEAIMEIYNQDDRGISYKEDDSPLTIADQAAHDIIFQGISSLAPDYGFIGEENKNAPFEKRSKQSYNWMVDPLDGTKEFISRNGEFTVNIALIQDQKPILGYVYIPVTQELFWAATNRGSWYMSPNHETPQKLSARNFDWKDTALRVLCSRSHLNDETQSFLNHLNEPTKISAGSALKFLRIARGEADVYPRLAPTMEWDTAAAEIVLIESGGTVLRWPDLEEMKYNKVNLLNPKFIAFGNNEDNKTLESLRDKMVR